MYSEQLVKEHDDECNKIFNELPSGPWTGEPNRVEFKHAGFDCLLSRNPWSGAWCGYVGVPPGHPSYEISYDLIMVDVHGGLTYGSKCSGNICHKTQLESDSLYWLGFDCMHWGDMYPKQLAYRTLSGWPMAGGKHKKYADVKWVEQETRSLAGQLAAKIRG